MRKVKWIKIFIVLALVAVGCVVIFVTINYFIARRPFYYAGTLETTKVILSSRVASDISDVFVSEGDNINAKQPLMELSCDAYKIMARQINSDYERAVQLVARGHMSQAEFDMIARNKQDNDLHLGWCVVASPIDGVVITRFREIGEVVAPGAVLMTVANPYDIWAYFYVPYELLHKLSIGQRVLGILPEAENMEFIGRIIKINDVAEFTPKNVQTRQERTRLVYGVKVKFDNPEMMLKPGMTIESTLLPQDE